MASKYTVEVKIRYSGIETHEVEVEAENAHEAEGKAADMIDKWNLDCDNPDIDDCITTILSEKEISEDTRCKLTPDMFGTK